MLMFRLRLPDACPITATVTTIDAMAKGTRHGRPRAFCPIGGGSSDRRAVVRRSAFAGHRIFFSHFR
jgi:hypothetical protein